MLKLKQADGKKDESLIITHRFSKSRHHQLIFQENPINFIKIKLKFTK